MNLATESWRHRFRKSWWSWLSMSFFAVLCVVYVGSMIAEGAVSQELGSDDVYEWDGQSQLFLSADTDTFCVIGDLDSEYVSVRVQAPGYKNPGGTSVATDITNNYPVELTCDGPVGILTGPLAWMRGRLLVYLGGVLLITLFGVPLAMLCRASWRRLRRRSDTSSATL